MIAVMYHYVKHPGFRLKIHSLDFARFQRQLDFFQKTHNLLSASALNTQDTIDFDPNGLVLTFDDGLREHAELVVPELDKRGLSAFFFVSTMPLLQRRLLNVHRIHALLATVSPDQLLQEIENQLRPEMMDPEGTGHFNETTYRLQTSAPSSETRIKLLLNYQIHHNDGEEILDQLTKKYVDEPRLFQEWYMTESQLKEVAKKHVIGAHSHSHRVLARLSPQDQEKEIEQSARILSCLIGKPCRWFCYPYGGVGSYNHATLNILQKHEFHWAFAVGERPVSPEDIRHRYEIPRLDCIQFKAEE